MCSVKLCPLSVCKASRLASVVDSRSDCDLSDEGCCSIHHVRMSCFSLLERHVI